MATKNSRLLKNKFRKWSATNFRKFFKWLIVNLVIVILVVVGLVYALSTWLDDYTRHGESVEVPTVVGIPLEEALIYFEQAGLKAMVVDSVYANTAPGSVIEQLPEGGLPVKSGRIVYLTINAKSKRMIKMVDVAEWSSRQAVSRLREIGFVVDSLHYEPYQFDDLVLKVTRDGVREMKPGKAYTEGTHVVLHVGRSKMELEAENDSTETAWFE